MTKSSLLQQPNYGYCKNIYESTTDLKQKMLTKIKPIIFLIFFNILLTAIFATAAPAPGIKRLGYAIQMGAFSSVNNAERFTNKLQSKGIEAFYFRKDNGIYAVRFGDFATKDKARSAAAKLVTSGIIDSYYIAPPNEIVFAKPKDPAWEKTKPTEIHKPKETRQTEINKTTQPTDKKETKPARGDRDMGSIAARTAERFVGIPYRWGGDNVIDGMDCSGFVRAVYNLCGVSIPRTSKDQYKVGESVIKKDIQDGDLVFFGSSESKINHVGIYVGEGRFVHAPRRGEDIKVTNIDESYFEKRFIGARRYFQ